MQEYERKDKKENMIYPNLTSQRMKLSYPFIQTNLGSQLWLHKLLQPSLQRSATGDKKLKSVLCHILPIEGG
jgi:hypothetical protein